MNISSAHRSTFAPLAALLLFFSQSALAQATQAPDAGGAPAGDADKGRQAFFDHSCNNCHGDKGEGAMGPEIAGIKRSFSEFTTALRKPKSSMPPFNNAAVPESQLADIYAFLKSLSPASGSNSTPAAGSTPAAALAQDSAPIVSAGPTAPGDAQHGKVIFTSYGCYECHGRVGQGATQTGAPRLAPPPLPISGFAAYVRHPGGNMPPYTSKVVSDADLADIFAFLQSIKPPTPAKDIPLLNQ